MADNRNLTIFQKLGQVLNPNNVKQTQRQAQTTQRFNIGGGELLKTDSKSEYETAKLQAQQNKYLGQVWKKVESGLFQQSINYETTRIGSYSDFEAMEFYPTIAAALDVMMEESTTLNDQGRMLNIYSDSKRVKGILEDLFFNRLDIHTSLPMWTRNTPIREDSVIPLLDGTEITIKELSNRVKNGEEIWSYAIQDGTKAIVPSKIIWCDLTRKDSELIRVTLDDGTYIDTTPDHEYMLRDGSYKRADALTEGQSLMPFYTITSTEKQDRITGYEKVFNPNTNKYEYTHRIVANDYIKDVEYENTIKEKPLLNHKVVSVVKLKETSDVYCLEAVGPNGEHDRHNFPVLGKDITGSYSRTSGVFLSNCKYGDNFVYMNIDDRHGIVGGKQMPNYEMERRETGLFDMISGRETMNTAETNTTTDKVKFFWRGRDVEFNSWQIAHFRLAGDDRRLPYGTSVLEKSRRIWKQLILSEDSMLVYRVTRAPERRVYKIYVGNIDDADVEQYVNTIADRFKRMPITDPQTGQMDLRYNQLSNDQDYFIPVRSENAPNPIETLPGASNLDQIADIEYLRSNLFTSLRVPKPFLGFEESAGEGKNLAMQDIRFSRTINRIQQSMLQELNKIAIIHLYILGFEEDLDNFTLTLNNPSTQAEMLKVEHTQLKVTLYKDAVSDAGNGFAPMSMTRAHREILGWSDDEIKQDLLEQRMEKAAAAELANTGAVIKHTGMFDIVDRIYGDYKAALEGGGAGGEGAEGGAEGGGGGGGLGGSFGGGGMSGEDLDFGGEEGGAEGEAEGGLGSAEAEGGETAGAEAGAEAGAAEEFGGETVAESIKKTEKLLTERKETLKKKLDDRTKKYQGRFVTLLESIKPEEKVKEEKVKIYDKNVKVNNSINSMIDDINKMLDE
jgi:hypothetical protein